MAVTVADDLTAEELERAALLASWRSRPGDPVSALAPSVKPLRFNDTKHTFHSR